MLAVKNFTQPLEAFGVSLYALKRRLARRENQF